MSLRPKRPKQNARLVIEDVFEQLEQLSVDDERLPACLDWSRDAAVNVNVACASVHHFEG